MKVSIIVTCVKSIRAFSPYDSNDKRCNVCQNELPFKE